MEIFNTTWKILIPIFKYPTKGLSVRELARQSHITHPTVLNIVKKLSKKNIITIEKLNKTFLVRGNFENEEFVEMKKLYNILSLKEFVNVITKNYKIDVIMVFGSYSKGIDIENSDIDLYIGYTKTNISEKHLKYIEKKLERKLDIFSGEINNFSKELKENIINGIKLYGWLKI